MAATGTSSASSHSGANGRGWAVSNPAVNSSESPGRKNPTRSPVSMNTVPRTPARPVLESRAEGSRNDGPRATVDGWDRAAVIATPDPGCRAGTGRTLRPCGRTHPRAPAPWRTYVAPGELTG